MTGDAPHRDASDQNIIDSVKNQYSFEQIWHWRHIAEEFYSPEAKYEVVIHAVKAFSEEQLTETISLLDEFGGIVLLGYPEYFPESDYRNCRYYAERIHDYYLDIVMGFGEFHGINCSAFQKSRSLVSDVFRGEISPMDLFLKPNGYKWIPFIDALKNIEAKAKCLPRQTEAPEIVVVDEKGFRDWWNGEPDNNKSKGLKSTYGVSAEELIFLINGLASVRQKDRRKHFTAEIERKTDEENAAKTIWQNLSRKDGVASKFMDPKFDWRIN